MGLEWPFSHQGTTLPPESPGDENPFTGIRSMKVFGTRCFLSVSAWLPCAPDHGNSSVINSFLGINVFSS